MAFVQFERILTRTRSSLWFRPALYAAVAVATLLLAPVIAPFIPDRLVRLIGLDGVYDLLDALANSLLAVAIFSLGIMASSMQVAAGAATPRARPLLMQDRTAQNAISTFIGGFIFAIVGIVGLSTSYYNDASRVVLFFASCVVIAAVILSLIRWIGRLSSLGDVSEVIDRLEDAAARALGDHARDPFLGGLPGLAPPDGFRLFPDRFGYLETVNIQEIARTAEHIPLCLLVRPGAYLDPTRPMLRAARFLDEETAARLRAAFVIGPDRSFDHDPRFGLIVLSEVASRALSPGVNDPGTAIDVIGTSVGLLARWSDDLAPEPEVCHPQLHVAPLSVTDLMEDAFRWIARDGAGQLEVQIRLQKGLATLAAHDPVLFGAAARALSQEALDRAALAMALPQDVERLRAEAARLATAG
ncbi:DUF2254 domain-containing protein [Cereibacter sphaeroides]|uniref:DUF2254 domain-containing protein n=1 Tax=Cereibacter sphaeroides TaxID=1063 RepID=UPI001F157541|nr:DUF2254 domain-containing protein [Cereibacter sphaeroides]MCE6957551.1 DUF2254 domain-containing protein [Cereibacter sphaeroides]MCE6967024.1 DUF2254 domain-containing protein [Cereibacter sphaeroides]MCE6971165.1 DUF2254 domain-containing protein [Cereibacter sphaeroides]